jgi:NADH dehydrogenase
VLGAVLADPPLNEYTIAGMLNDADLDPTSAMRDLGYRPLGVTAGFARCFSSPAAEMRPSLLSQRGSS